MGETDEARRVRRVRDLWEELIANLSGAHLSALFPIFKNFQRSGDWAEASASLEAVPGLRWVVRKMGELLEVLGEGGDYAKGADPTEATFRSLWEAWESTADPEFQAGDRVRLKGDTGGPAPEGLGLIVREATRDDVPYWATSATGRRWVVRVPKWGDPVCWGRDLLLVSRPHKTREETLSLLRKLGGGSTRTVESGAPVEELEGLRVGQRVEVEPEGTGEAAGPTGELIELRPVEGDAGRARVRLDSGEVVERWTYQLNDPAEG